MLTALIDHLAWADALTLEVLRAMPVAAPETERSVTIYAHLAASAHVWLARLEGLAPTHPVWPALDLEQAAALSRETSTALRAFAEELDAADLARVVSYRTSAGHSYENTVGDILTHVALHGSYHRGQLALLARQGGGTPAATDFIVFARNVEVLPRRSG
jgi:uncharacterized damage-inducible protein DinB